MIELENVTMTYPGGMTALKNVNINIEKGEFVFIVGSSGSGKTTLIKLLLKELEPTSGSIRVAGYNYNTIKKKNIPKVRRKIGVVFQNFRLLKDRTIYENVAFAQRVIQTPARYIRRRVPAMLGRHVSGIGGRAIRCSDACYPACCNGISDDFHFGCLRFIYAKPGK